MRSMWILALVIVVGAACGRAPLLQADDPIEPGPTEAAGTSGSAGTSGGAGTMSAAGTSGSAGTIGAAGTFGAAGTSTPGTAGTGTSGAAGTGGDIPCSSTTMSSMPIAPRAFCFHLLATCTNVVGFVLPADYDTFAQCEASYVNSTQQHCQSYHLCANAVSHPVASRRIHCPHAVGLGPCAN